MVKSLLSVELQKYVFSYTKLIGCHNLQSPKRVDFFVNYNDLIPNYPPSQGGKDSDTIAAPSGCRSCKIRTFGQLKQKERAIELHPPVKKTSHSAGNCHQKL